MAITKMSVITPEITTIEYRELVSDLMSDLVHGDTSPLKDAIKTYDDYLTSNSTIDMDSEQKAGAMAGFLRESYKDAQSQVLNAALAIVKANAQYTLDGPLATAKINTERAQLEKLENENQILVKQITAADHNNEILEVKKNNDKLDGNIKRAQLKKQYGVHDGYELQIGDARNSYTPYQSSTTGAIEWLRVDSHGNYIAAREAAEAMARNTGFSGDLTPTELATVNGYHDSEYSKKGADVNTVGSYVAGDYDLINQENAAWNSTHATYGTATTTDPEKAERGVANSVTVGTTIPNIDHYEGAIDKQIKGFDVINYKDVLTTMDQRVALMQNAKIPESNAEDDLRADLISAIIHGPNPSSPIYVPPYFKSQRS